MELKSPESKEDQTEVIISFKLQKKAPISFISWIPTNEKKNDF